MHLRGPALLSRPASLLLVSGGWNHSLRKKSQTDIKGNWGVGDLERGQQSLSGLGNGKPTFGSPEGQPSKANLDSLKL